MIEAPETLETDRLLLRKAIPEDAQVVFDAYAQDEEVTRYLTWTPNGSVDETRAFLRRATESWELGTEYTWAIMLKEGRVLIGMIGARVSGSIVNLGYVLGRAYWNKGYMTEAVTAVTDWALGQDEVYRVWAVCDLENIASARVLQKAGLELEGVLSRWVVFPNLGEKPRDCLCFARVK